MLVAMFVRCEQCGHESAPRYHYCGMCGAKLPEPQPPGPLKPLPPLSSSAEPPKREPLPPLRVEPVRPLDTEPVRPVNSEPVTQVSGPSFLGLTDEPSGSVSYLLEDELSESHWGRSAVLFLILIGIGVAGWHWRNDLRTYVASRLAQRPNSQSEQVNPPEAPSTAPGSELGAGTAAAATTPVDKPMTGAGDLPATPPTAVPPGQSPAASQNAPAAVPNTVATGSQTSGTTTGASGQPGNPAPAAAPAATAPTQTGAVPETQAAPSGKSTATDQTTVAKSDAPVPASAVTKHVKSKETAPASTDADQLEAQGEKYLYGSGGSASCSRAQTDLQAAAEHGSAKADSVLGTMYATGHCVSRDLPLAYRWFAKALQQDPSNARLERDLQVLWNQMSASERQLAMRH
jgi:hypothetical protein